MGIIYTQPNCSGVCLKYQSTPEAYNKYYNTSQHSCHTKRQIQQFVLCCNLLLKLLVWLIVISASYLIP